jgi:hypothetical protein
MPDVAGARALRELGKIRGLATTIPISYILNNVPRTASNYLTLSCCPPISCEKPRQRGCSGSTHEEIVISRAFARVVFFRGPDDN